MLSYLSVGSGRLYWQSLVFAMLDKPHSLSIFFPEQLTPDSDNLDGLQSQLNCPDTWLEPQTECSALGWISCALRSGIPGSASCAPAAQPGVHPWLLFSLLHLQPQLPFGTPAARGVFRGYSCPGARLHFSSYRISEGSCWLIPVACQGVLDGSPALRFGVCWAVHGSQ